MKAWREGFGQAYGRGAWNRAGKEPERSGGDAPARGAAGGAYFSGV